MKELSVASTGEIVGGGASSDLVECVCFYRSGMFYEEERAYFKFKQDTNRTECESACHDRGFVGAPSSSALFRIEVKEFRDANLYGHFAMNLESNNDPILD